MNIVVCIKQVPDTTEIKIDPVKNTLIRTGVPSIMNPFDKNALETGLQLKDRYGGKVPGKHGDCYFHGTASGEGGAPGIAGYGSG